MLAVFYPPEVVGGKFYDYPAVNTGWGWPKAG